MRSLALTLVVLMLAAPGARAAQAAAQPPATRPPAAQPPAAHPPAAQQPATQPPAAQPPGAQPPAPPAANAPAPNAASTPPQPENYSYNPDGRRDPFLSLLGTGGGEVRGSRRVDGAAGLTTAEISVRGVMQSKGALIAMVQGPDNRTYIVRAGDKLADGTIRSITPDGLVVVQEVNDPLSLVKQREVRKLLRSVESAK